MLPRKNIKDCLGKSVIKSAVNCLMVNKINIKKYIINLLYVSNGNIHYFESAERHRNMTSFQDARFSPLKPHQNLAFHSMPPRFVLISN